MNTIKQKDIIQDYTDCHVNICNGPVKNSWEIVVEDQGLFIVRHYDTEVLTFDQNAGTITLNNGGHYSVTTKKLLNHYLARFGYSISQKDYQWYVSGHGKVVGYVNGMILEVR